MPHFTLSLLILSLAVTTAACNKKPQDADVQTAASVQDVSTEPAPDDAITADDGTTNPAQSLNKSDVPCMPRISLVENDDDIRQPDDDDDDDEYGMPVPKPNPAKDIKAKDFSDRKPFVLTVSTDIPIVPDNPRARRHSPGFKGKHAWDWINHLMEGNDDEIKIDTNPKSWKKETIRYLVAVHTVDGKYPLQYDLDCDGDGVYEHKNLKDAFVCKYKYNSGDHQIRLRGDIPAIWLCANGMLIEYPQGGDAIITKGYLNGEKCDYGISPDDFRCNLPYRQPTVCPASVDPACRGMRGRNLDSYIDMDCDEEYKFCKDGYDEFAEDMHDRVRLVTSIDAWGDVEWKSMMGFAADCSRLNQLPSEAPNLTQVTDMSHAFERAWIFNQPLELWDVSHVEDMTNMFQNAEKFNQPLEKWDVSHVENMDSMFYEAYEFNQPLDPWDISSVRRMDYMFLDAEAFSHYPQNWILHPDARHERMFSGTKVEELADQKPLRQREYCSD